MFETFGSSPLSAHTTPLAKEDDYHRILLEPFKLFICKIVQSSPSTVFIVSFYMQINFQTDIYPLRIFPGIGFPIFFFFTFNFFTL